MKFLLVFFFVASALISKAASVDSLPLPRDKSRSEIQDQSEWDYHTGNCFKKITLRGTVHCGGEASCLVIVDGIAVSNSELGKISADNISSITILKDKTAAALYGSKGENGVIVVKTKCNNQSKSFLY